MNIEPKYNIGDIVWVSQIISTIIRCKICRYGYRYGEDRISVQKYIIRKIVITIENNELVVNYAIKRYSQQKLCLPWEISESLCFPTRKAAYNFGKEQLKKRKKSTKKKYKINDLIDGIKEDRNTLIDSGPSVGNEY